MDCYICESRDNEIAFYYNVNPEYYVHLNNYDPSLHSTAKKICNACSVDMLLRRQGGFSICGSCKCYNKYQGCPPTVSNNCTIIHSNAVDGSWKIIDKTDLVPNSVLCETCFGKLKTTGKIVPAPTSRSEIEINSVRDEMQCSLCSCKWKDNKFPDDSLSWAYMWGKNMFSYKNDIFEIETKIDISEEGQICNNCLGELEYKPYLSVKCGVCHNKFKALYDCMINQADGCSSYVYDNGINCGYGSLLDGSYIKFVTERPKELCYGSSVCDLCIQKLIDDGICCKDEDEYCSM